MRAEQAVNSYKWQCVSRSNLLSWASYGSDYAYRTQTRRRDANGRNGIKLHSNSIDRAVVRKYTFTLFNYLSVCVIAAFIFLRVCVSKLIKSLHSDGTSQFFFSLVFFLFWSVALHSHYAGDERRTSDGHLSSFYERLLHSLFTDLWIPDAALNSFWLIFIHES